MRYATIVADPPWQTTAGPSGGGYEKGVDGKQQPWTKTASNKSRPLPYPSMTLVEIAAYAPPVADQAHLYLWTINRWLREAFDVIDAWGFKYSTTLVWAKKPMGGGLGGCYGLSTEYCLFAKTRHLACYWSNWAQLVRLETTL